MAELGNVIHKQMQGKYGLSHLNEGVYIEPSIRHINNNNKFVYLYPDIVNKKYLEVYEIKPLSEYGNREGPPKIRLYVWQMNINRSYGKVGWHAGTRYNPNPGIIYPVLVPPCEEWAYIEAGNVGGVLYYKAFKRRRRRKVPRELPVPVANNIREIVKMYDEEPQLANQILDSIMVTQLSLDQIGFIVTTGLALSMASIELRVSVDMLTASPIMAF